MCFLLITFLFLSSLAVQAQELAYEYQTLYLADGQILKGWVAYDCQQDGVFFKADKAVEARLLTGQEISDFSYQGENYIALPFRQYKPVIFRIVYQGNEVAILQKHLNRNNYMLVDEDFTGYPLGSLSTADSLYLDQVTTTTSEYGVSTSTYENEYRVENCLFLATLDGISTWSLELSYIHRRKGRKTLFVSPYKNVNRELVRLLSIDNRHEKESLRTYIFSNQLDIKSPSDLTMTLKSFEQIN